MWLVQYVVIVVNVVPAVTNRNPRTSDGMCFNYINEGTTRTSNEAPFRYSVEYITPSIKVQAPARRLSESVAKSRGDPNNPGLQRPLPKRGYGR